MDSSFSDGVSPSNFANAAKVLLIGETGTGKSTFINYLTNYFRGGSLTNPRIAIPCKHHPYPTESFPHCELDIDDNTQSKTNSCFQYTFTDAATHKRYVFLDTPGLSDTRSREQSETNQNKMLDAITELSDLTAIVIVINGSLNRLSKHLRTIISQFNGNLPDVVLENVIVILTNAKKHESSFDLNVLNLRGRVYPFYMQNGAFVSNPSTWRQSTRDELQQDWDHSMHQIKCILQTIDSFQQVPTESFAQLKQIRNEIRSALHQMRLEMIQLQKVHIELSQLDRSIPHENQDTATYQERIQSQAMEKLEVVDASYFSTICGRCNQICHSNCRLKETATNGAQIFAQCSAMLNGRCQQCPNRCSYRDHYHAKRAFHVVRKNLRDTLDDLTKDYRTGNADRGHPEARILTAMENKQLLETALKQKVKEIKQKSVDLCKIFSPANLVREFKYLVKQLTVEWNCQQNVELQSLMQSSIRSLKKFTLSLEEIQEKNQQKRPPMQIIDREQPMRSKPIDLKSLKTTELIELYRNTTAHDSMSSILHELHLRAQGKSTSPLAPADQILLINTYLEQYNHRTVEQLSYAHRKLQQQIDQIIKDDILNLVQVQPALLMQNFVVQTLLATKERNSSSVDPTLPEDASQSFSHQTINPTSLSIHRTPYPVSGPTLPQAPVQPSGLSSPPPRPAASVTPAPFPEMPLIPYSQASKPSSFTSAPIGFSHLTTTPYPSHDASSPMPALPEHFSPAIRDSKQQELCYPRTTNAQSSDHHGFMPMPMPTADQPETNQNCSRDFRFPPDNIREPERLSSSYERSYRPDVVPFLPNSIGSPKPPTTRLINGTSKNNGQEDLEMLENSKLLFMYATANLERNAFRRELIHQELERRCYGEHPLLMKEKKSLLQEKLAQHGEKRITELVPLQLRIQRKIREHLKDGDVILIDDIPPELIVEAHALNQLVLSKSDAGSHFPKGKHLHDS